MGQWAMAMGQWGNELRIASFTHCLIAPLHCSLPLKQQRQQVTQIAPPDVPGVSARDRDERVPNLVLVKDRVEEAVLSEQIGLVAADRRPEQPQRAVRRVRIRQQIRERLLDRLRR